MNLHFTYESRDTLKSFSLFLFVKTGCGTQRQIRNLNFKSYRLWFTCSTQRRPCWSFHVVVLKRTAKKCTKIYNAPAQLLFCSLNLLFSDVSVPVAVVVFLNSLLVKCVLKCSVEHTWGRTSAPLNYGRLLGY